MSSYVHVLRTPEYEFSRESAGEKWCFGCRKRLPHDAVTFTPVDRMSYYGPHWRYSCSRCGRDRVDFPGTWTERGWEGET